MRILQINSCNYGSTGNMMVSLHQYLLDHGCVSYVAYPGSRSNCRKSVNNGILIGNRWGRYLHVRLASFTGYNGCFQPVSTRRFLRRIEALNPDLVHLHNLHNCYINLGELFSFLKEKDIPVIWTLHDCWSFTGHCPHFAAIGCYKWTSGCFECPQYRKYPALNCTVNTPNSHNTKTQMLYSSAFPRLWITQNQRSCRHNQCA